MSDMKCPICGEKIEHIEDGWCNCKNRCIGSGSISLWQELIRTREALDVAVDAMTQCSSMRGVELIETINAALAKIKDTIEQKDVK